MTIDVDGIIADIAELKGLAAEDAKKLPAQTQMAVELAFKLGEALIVSLAIIANRVEAEQQ